MKRDKANGRKLNKILLSDLSLYSYEPPTFDFQEDYTFCSNTERRQKENEEAQNALNDCLSRSHSYFIPYVSLTLILISL